jgi:GNAT superfamily N-acetyltransferase
MDHPDAARLCDLACAELIERYGDYGVDVPHPEDFSPPGGAFLVLYVGDRAVACGGAKRIAPGVGEIKRIFVEETFRRKGHGRRLLAELERTTRALGLSILRLETGILQQESVALYESAGYSSIPPFGRFPYLARGCLPKRDTPTNTRSRGRTGPRATTTYQLDAVGGLDRTIELMF